ncbi:hypothetical protein ZORO111903_16520 [Zobellia roscoffensis]
MYLIYQAIQAHRDLGKCDGLAGHIRLKHNNLFFRRKWSGPVPLMVYNN